MESSVDYTLLDIGEASIDEAVAALRHLPKNTKELKVEGFLCLGHDCAQRIAEHLNDLTALDLGNNKIGPSNVRYIAKHLNNLAVLNLSANKIGDDGARYIAKHLSKLTTLNLGNNEIGPGGARYIAEHLSNLTTLNLKENWIGDEGTKYISTHLKTLTTLNLEKNQIGSEGARHIAEHLKNLTTLILDRNRIGLDGAKHIAKHLKNLTTLELDAARIGDEGANHIANHLDKLTVLNLDDNRIGSEGARHIAEHLTNLTTLKLNYNDIGYNGVQYIAENLNTLTELSLWSNRIGDEGVRHIAAHLKNLQTLILGRDEIGDRGAQQIAAHLNNLTTLDLSNNQIGDEGIRHIAENLEQLTRLDLYENKIGDDGARHIAVHLSNLDRLDLNNNPVAEVPKDALSDIEALKAYFQTEEIETKVPNLTVRAMLIGEPEVGKSTVLKALAGLPYILGSENRTHGLERYQRKFNSVEHDTLGAQDFVLDLWDMGGQSLQHMMHGFFFRSDALYILVINENSKLETIRPWLDQLSDQRKPQEKKITIIPTANTRKGSGLKMPSKIIDQLKSDYSRDFDWSDSVRIGLTDDMRLKTDELEFILQNKLRSRAVKEYWKSIDDISESIAAWKEPYLSGPEFSTHLMNDKIFKQSFERINTQVTSEGKGETLNEYGFLNLIIALLDHNGFLRKMDRPNIVILDPVWIDKGLYSLLPPEDNALPSDSTAKIFFDIVSHVQKGNRLPGIFTLDDIIPLWKELDIKIDQHQDLLDVLCNPYLGLVIRNPFSGKKDEYFIPAYLDHVQEIADSELLESIHAAYRSALYCMVFEQDYWPPYLIYKHMVYCGADQASSDGKTHDFALHEDYTRISKQHYWIKEHGNNHDLRFELILLRNKLWCFGYSGHADNLPVLQDKMKDIKKGLYRFLPQSYDDNSNDMATLIPCPECMAISVLDHGGEAPVDNPEHIPSSLTRINFYHREQLITHQPSGGYLQCSENTPHYKQANEILEHLKETNFGRKAITLTHAVIAISKFAYMSGLAGLEGEKRRPVKLCNSSTNAKFNIGSIDGDTLQKMWEGQTNIENMTPHRLGGALIQRLTCLSALTDMPVPIGDFYTRSMTGDKNPVEQNTLTAQAEDYLKSIALAIIRYPEKSCEALSPCTINYERVTPKSPKKWKDAFLNFLRDLKITQ